MANASFVQDRFLGGEWSPHAQGRVSDPAYKQSLNVCLNGYPVETGAWTRRQGFRYLAHTRSGAAAVLRAFDFTTTQPYQLEFTAGYVRFFAGLSLVTTQDTLDLVGVTPDTPGKVLTAEAFPADWANGDTVIYDIGSEPCTAPLLCGRQFVIANLDTANHQFTMLDAVTGAAIDGAGLWTAPEGTVGDTVRKVFELATPYTAAELDALRTVQDETTVLVLHSAHQPRTISSSDGDPNPFQIAAQDFEDGPWLDINDTTTTLTASGTSGSVTITASSANGINDGTGFATTDVGRLIRLQGAPAAWSNAVTYAKAALVTGSDNNIYSSVAGGNINHDPTTDNTSTYWQISAQTVDWTWLKITARTNSTHVIATIMGDNLPAAVATTVWRLGLYSDTTGWPTCGAYHEGRLWLSGVVGNRVDASKSNDHFNFSPTAPDGTVADDNAIAATFNSKEVNAIFWMLTTEDGLLCGTQGGEWRVKASSLDDPISPTTIQARRVSTYGCANVEPVNASRNLFVQRQARKLLAHERMTDNKYGADNLTKFSDHLVTDGIAEISWQQEPSLLLWSRTEAGGLVGAVFNRATNQADDINGWFEVELGSGRSVTSISAGPAYDGLSDALYAVTNQTDDDEPDFGVRWVEYLMPRFDAATEDWGAFFVDGGANPCCALVKSIANGDSFDGLRIYGLWHLNGKTISPVLGGLDLGDRTVAGGLCDVPFSSDPDAKFTLAFLTGLSDGTDYGVFALGVTSYVLTPAPDPPVAANSLMAIVGGTFGTLNGSSGYQMMLDPDHGNALEHTQGGFTAGLYWYETTLGTPIFGHSNFDLFGPQQTWNAGITYSIGNQVFGSDNELYTSKTNSNINHNPAGGLDTTNWQDDGAGPGQRHTLTATYMVYSRLTQKAYAFIDGGNNSDTCRIDGPTLVGDLFTTTQPVISGQYQCVVSHTVSNAYSDFVISESHGVSSHSVITIQWGAGTTGQQGADLSVVYQSSPITEERAECCVGRSGINDHSSFFVMGHKFYNGTSTTDTLGFYEYFLQGLALDFEISIRPIKKIAPADIDATWTHILEVRGPMYDTTDHSLIFFAITDDAVTTKFYLVKISALNGAVIWKAALDTLPSSPFTTIAKVPEQQNLLMTHLTKSQWVCFPFTTGNHNAYIFDLTDGSITTQTFNAGYGNTGGGLYDEVSSSLTSYGTYSQSTGTVPNYIGTYLPAHSNAYSSKWNRIFFGNTFASSKVYTEYSVPASIGFTYTSRGQLLRPDYGNDGGAQNGPAFGKKRRLHWYGAAFYRTRSVSFGTDFAKLRATKLTDPGTTAADAPALYSGTVSYTIDNDYSFNSQIAWEITRPYPATVLAVSGFIETMDK